MYANFAYIRFNKGDLLHQKIVASQFHFIDDIFLSLVFFPAICKPLAYKIQCENLIFCNDVRPRFDALKLTKQRRREYLWHESENQSERYNERVKKKTKTKNTKTQSSAGNRQKRDLTQANNCWEMHCFILVGCDFLFLCNSTQ